MLQPTAPLRTAQDIDRSLEILITNNFDGVISVVKVDNYHPFKMKKINKGLLYDYEELTTENPPRQSLPPVYIVNGAIYATKRNVLVNQNTFKGERCAPYIMPEHRSVNIDSASDFAVAEYFLKKDGH